MGRLSSKLNQDKPDLESARIFAKELSKKIRAETNPVRIVLFGSAATGEFGHTSDLDILIVVESEKDLAMFREKIHNLKVGADYPIDYLFVTQQRFDEQKDVGGVCFVANKEGIVI